MSDLVAADAAALSDGGDAVRRWVGSPVEDQATPWNALNPIGLTPQCPVILAHGEEDEDVPIAMSRACAEAYIARGSTAELVPLPATTTRSSTLRTKVGEAFKKVFLDGSCPAKVSAELGPLQGTRKAHL